VLLIPIIGLFVDDGTNLDHQTCPSNKNYHNSSDLSKFVIPTEPEKAERTKRGSTMINGLST